MSTESTNQNNLSEKKDFLVRSSSLKDVRNFSREVFDETATNFLFLKIEGTEVDGLSGQMSFDNICESI